MNIARQVVERSGGFSGPEYGNVMTTGNRMVHPFLGDKEIANHLFQTARSEMEWNHLLRGIGSVSTYDLEKVWRELSWAIRCTGLFHILNNLYADSQSIEFAGEFNYNGMARIKTWCGW